MKEGITTFLQGCFGENILYDPNFEETPDRIVRAYYEFLNDGKNIDKEVAAILKKKFPSKYNSMICTNWIETVSLCPHHLLPVQYRIAIAYLQKPSYKTSDGETFFLGASKLARLATVLSKRAVLQEELTHDIYWHITEALNPSGVAIIIDGVHGCMSCRGINTNATYKTSKLTGAFLRDTKVRSEFFELLKI